jgi:SAM-dependent methyltransferase
LSRALDLGCGRGQHTRELVRRGWEVVGIDYATRAIDAARRQGIDGATFMVGDVTDLPVDDLGSFDFFLDIGCFQHLDADQRTGAGRGITTVAKPAATLLMMAFSRPTPIGSFVKGISRDDVQAAFPGWDLLSVHDAPTDGMDWPMRGMQPLWMRLRRRT